MVTRADIITVRPASAAELVTGSAPVGDVRQEQFQRSLAGLIGQSVQAEVMSRLNDGSFLVKVADTAARMMLPPGAQIGQQVPLTLVSVTPRPTFQITGAPAEDGAPVHIAYAEAGPALLPGPEGSPLRAEPLVYLDGSAGHLAAPGLKVIVPGTAGVPTEAPTAAAPKPPAGAADETAAAQAKARPDQAAASQAPAAAAAAAEQEALLTDLPKLPAPLVADPDDPASFLAQPKPATAAQAAALQAAASKTVQPAGSTATDEAGTPAPADEAAAAATDGAAASAPAAKAQAADPARPLSHAAALLGKAPLVPASQLPPLDAKTTPAALSDTAKVLAQVLTQALKIRNAPTTLVGRAPLVSRGDAEPEQIDQALQQAVGKSGLFYESHVAQWAFGQRPLAELVSEPQMQQALGAAPAQEAVRPGGPPSDPASAGFINLQLATHEQQKVAWQGQVWPGQDMQWEIKKDPPERRGGGQQEEEPGWRSALRLRFAKLGTLDATVALRGDQLQIKIHADNADTASLLRAYGSALEAALAAAGVPLTGFQVSEPAPLITGGGDG